MATALAPRTRTWLPFTRSGNTASPERMQRQRAAGAPEETSQREGFRWWQIVVGLAGLGLVAAVVLRELRKPKEERTWEGKIAGVVPYNLRPPTVHRLRQSYWNPENPRVLQPRAFGVGWDVNFGALARRRHLLATARHVSPDNESDIRSAIDETLRRNPQATYRDVLAAWHVQRGVEIDDAEADRVCRVFDRMRSERAATPGETVQLGERSAKAS